MSNCLEELKDAYIAVFQDLKYACPDLGDEFDLDLTRLLRLADERGLPVFLVDLPALGKHLDRCLAEGAYSPSRLPLSKRVSSRVVIPKFLRGLYLRVFSKSGHVLKDCCIEAVTFLRQIFLMAKKYPIQCADSKVVLEVRNFVDVDRGLPEPSRYWTSNDTKVADVVQFTPFEEWPDYVDRLSMTAPGTDTKQLFRFLKMMTKVSSFITSSLGSYNPLEWRCNHGPGAVSERTGRFNKYSWSNWSDRLESAYPIADYGYHNWNSWAHDTEKSSLPALERGARLISVPKTFSGPRLIAAEPTEHQWCQQNLWHYFRDSSARCWIDRFVSFRDQRRNQQMAIEGSQTGTLSTVDLSSASDSVSCDVVGLMFRNNPVLLHSLYATRSRFVEQDLTTSVERLISLRKFSTMGNSCTFPVESLLFLAVTVSSVLVSRGEGFSPQAVKKLAGEVTVFGDDIVAPTDSLELLVAGLELLRFKVNSQKSYWTGLFRESCGVDAYEGHRVTPIYFKGTATKSKPESSARALDTSRNFFLKFYVNVSNYVVQSIEEQTPLVRADSEVVGRTTFCRLPPQCFKRRWNANLQIGEIRLPIYYDRRVRVSTSDDTSLLQYFTEDPEPFIKWTHGYTKKSSSRIKSRSYWVGEHLLGLKVNS